MHPVYLTAVILLIGCSSTYTGSPSDHFDGDTFYYPGAPESHTLREHLRWLHQMDTVEWPKWVNDAKQPPPPKQVSGAALRVTYINHATVLIQTNGINILTDPIWSFRAGPASFMGTKRVRHPGVKFGDLPHIDYVIISHNHYDHLDLPTLRRLHEKFHPVFVVGLGNGSLLRGEKLTHVQEIDWWDTTVFETNITLTMVPACHNSGRGLSDSNETLFAGYVIETPQGHIYFAGDTGYCDVFEQISQRFPTIRLAIVPIGSYEPRWFMKNQHMSPEDAVMAHETLLPTKSMGIHYATFAEHPEQTIDQHEIDLKKSLAEHNMHSDDFWILKFGEGKDVPMRQQEKH